MCQDFSGSITGKIWIFVFGQERTSSLAGLIYSCQGTVLFWLLHRQTTCPPEIRFMPGRYPALTWFHLSQNNSANIDILSKCRIKFLAVLKYWKTVLNIWRGISLYSFCQLSHIFCLCLIAIPLFWKEGQKFESKTIKNRPVFAHVYVALTFYWGQLVRLLMNLITWPDWPFHNFRDLKSVDRQFGKALNGQRL